MSFALTPRQQKIFDFIKAEIRAKGVAPTLRDMQAHLGLNSAGTICTLLNRLEERGHIRRLRSTGRRSVPRAIELIDPTDVDGAARDALTRIGVTTAPANIALIAAALEQCRERSAA